MNKDNNPGATALSAPPFILLKAFYPFPNNFSETPARNLSPVRHSPVSLFQNSGAVNPFFYFCPCPACISAFD